MYRRPRVFFVDGFLVIRVSVVWVGGWVYRVSCEYFCAQMTRVVGLESVFQ